MHDSRVTHRIAAQRLSSTIASSEQEAASTLVPAPESVSRCLLPLTQAFDGISVARAAPLGYALDMTVEELKALPTAEKFQIMEALWEDLRARSDSSPISQEIKDLLDARRARVRSGASQMHDWDAVKGSLGRT